MVGKARQKSLKHPPLQREDNLHQCHVPRGMAKTSVLMRAVLQILIAFYLIHQYATAKIRWILTEDRGPLKQNKVIVPNVAAVRGGISLLEKI